MGVMTYMKSILINRFQIRKEPVDILPQNWGHEVISVKENKATNKQNQNQGPPIHRS